MTEKPEPSIVLPCGVTLRRNDREDTPEYEGPNRALLRGPLHGRMGDWVCGFGDEPPFGNRIQSRDECIAWLDARVLELRAALGCPPGAEFSHSTLRSLLTQRIDHALARRIGKDHRFVTDGIVNDVMGALPVEPGGLAARELADLLLAHDDKVTADPFAVFDRGAFGDRFAALVAKYRAAKEGTRADAK